MSAENGSSAVLDIDLDDIDDKEFDIPPIDKAPTLESILNAPDDDAALTDNVISATLFQAAGADHAEDAGSLSSHDETVSEHSLTTSARQQPHSHNNVHQRQHASILRHVILKMVSSQLLSAADRVDAGLPTALAVSSLLAVGTSHGVVLVFDAKQTLRWCLGGAGGVGAEFGAVSALGLNGDCTRLLVGYARGQITMWDLTNGKLLRTVTDAHPPAVAVLHVKFTEDRTVAVMSDSGGSVYSLEFKRLIGVRTCDSQCLFSGSRGEVCVIEPLCIPHSQTHVDHGSHPVRDVLLLAMASLSKVLIVTLRPDLKVRYVHSLTGDSATLPLLAWHFVVIQLSDKDKVVDPVLTFARDQTVYFVQIMCRTIDDIKIVPLQKFELGYKLLSISWLNSRTMLFIDTMEHARLIDVRSEDEVEVIDIADVHLVYSNSFYKSLATGGNVSAAMACAGERACYHSVLTSASQLVLLGTKAVHVLVLRTWRERLDLLVKQYHYAEALSLARSFYDGTARSIVGLTGTQQQRAHSVSQYIMNILDQYVDVAMTKLCPSHGKIEELEAYYQDVVKLCVDNCLLVKQTDFLFGRLYDLFSMDSIAHAVYLESLEPYILDDTLTAVTPGIMQDFVDHYEKRGALQAVESCIVHMDVASLDIHQVVSLCWTHGLYDAILYIYNCAMRDYTTPLEELLALLAAAISTGKQLTYDQVQLGNKILVYISCCMAGLAYPRGEIPADKILEVKDKVLHCVTALHTSNPLETEPAYPHLCTLLRFDTREFFNVLALCFEDVDMKLKKKQRIVDILLLLMVESVGFTPTQVGVLFTFLARQMARHNNELVVNRTLFEQVLESLCSPTVTNSAGLVEEASRHEERQQAVLELYAAGGLDHFDQLRLIELAKSAGFYRVCEVIHCSRREFDKIVLCYCHDKARSASTVNYIQSILADTNITDVEKQRVRTTVLDNVRLLVQTDARRVAKLLIITLSVPVSDIVRRLDTEQENVVYDFLNQVFDFIGSASVEVQQSALDESVYNKYIELLCRNAAQSDVVRFLQSTTGYQIDLAIDLCRQHNMNDAVVYLLEKSGDINGAFEVSLECLNATLANLTVQELIELDLRVFEIIRLLQRTSNKFENAERERVWFRLLDSLVDSVRLIKSKSDGVAKTTTTTNDRNSEMRRSCTDGMGLPLSPRTTDTIEDGVKSAMKQVINAMMSHVALPAILQRIVATDDSGVNATFGNVRDLLTGVLEACSYERTLLSTCARLVNRDLHGTMMVLTANAVHGTIVEREHCAVCRRSVISNGGGGGGSIIASQHGGGGISAKLVVFNCGHAFHQSCLIDHDRSTTVSPTRGSSATTPWRCLLCCRAGPAMKRSTARDAKATVSSVAASSRQQPSEGILSPSSSSVTSPHRDQLDSVQNASVLRLHMAQKTTSRLALLTELNELEKTRSRSSSKTGSTPLNNTAATATGLLTNDVMMLRLAPPPALLD